MSEGILRITESESVEIQADSARMHVTVSGENFIYGNAAAEKCKEVKEFVTSAKAIGIPDADIKIKSVHVKIDSGLLSRSSKGVYSLAVEVRDLSKLSDLLGALNDRRAITLDQLEWCYKEEDAKLACVEAAMRKAKRKADTMTFCVGHRVIAIKVCSDNLESLSHDVTIKSPYPPPAHSKMRASASPPADIGTEFKSSKEIRATVSVEFLIAPS